MEKLCDMIGYHFNDIALLKNAMAHSSYANEMKRQLSSNERLEFLGDSILSIIISEHLYRNFPDLSEGDLTRTRAIFICEKSLFEFAQSINLGDHILLGRGEVANGARQRASLLADAFEALIAAIYLDGGMEPARKFVMQFVEKKFQHSYIKAGMDYKTTLQEIVQHNKEERLSYKLIKEDGPPHNKTFYVEVCLNSNVMGKGKGKSKKEAEQLAAKEALTLMGKI